MTAEFLAPLTRAKLEEMAVEFYGNSPTSGTVRNAAEFAILVLKEAERLAEPWKKRQLCEVHGHNFVNFAPQEEFCSVASTDLKQVLWEWKAKSISCTNCDATLEVTYKEKI